MKAGEIIAKAADLGIENVGITRVEILEGYRERTLERISRIINGDAVYGWLLSRNFSASAPWTKSLVIAAFDIAHYRLPAALRGRVGKHYLAEIWGKSASRESRARAEFEAWLRASGLRTGEAGIDNQSDRQIMGLRWAALKAGLGLVRRNNFFYGPKGGSYQWLWAWAIDEEMEYSRTPAGAPCPENCDRCLKACPTGALSAPYVMDMSRCVTRLTAFNAALSPEDPLNARLGGWLYGCDACQDACPWNAGAWRETDELPGLAELAPYLEPERLLSLSYGEMSRILKPRFSYLEEKDMWKWKFNALNLMANAYRPEYEPALRAALNDPEPRVREKASYILSSAGKAPTGPARR